jgi:hypothetical protein
MRRLGLAVVIVMAGACGALRDAFSAHPGVAASAAGQELSVERLATWVAAVKRVQPKAENFGALAAVYVDYMVFAAQLAKGRNLDDSLLVAQANWPTEAQRRWNLFHERLVQGRAHAAAAEVDSAYAAGTVRLFQHVLIQVPASASPAVVAEKRATITRLLPQATLREGTNFAAVAQRYSEDPGSKAGGGYLSVSGRGQFVPPFETAAWQLAPGAVSGVVRTSFGFHIIRRPPLAEVRDAFGTGLDRLRSLHIDSSYVDSLAARRKLHVTEGAPAAVRQVFGDLIAARTNHRTLVTYRGGKFRVSDLVRWIFAIDPDEVRFLPSASDDQIRQFLTLVVKRDLLLAQVDSAGVQVTPDDWREIRAAYDSALTLLEGELALSPRLFVDSAATPDARVQLAATHVDAYLERAFAGKAQFYPVPPFLAAALREKETWSINPAGVAEAVERAAALQTAGDSAPRPGLRQAPGGPPIPRDTGPTHPAP